MSALTMYGTTESFHAYSIPNLTAHVYFINQKTKNGYSFEANSLPLELHDLREGSGKHVFRVHNAVVCRRRYFS